ncbi:hypothetical protein HRI_000758600 [Hibiscus trionum]|uniref:Myb-like domain-containing protein n=1 Tax=Hibiscus trionum TaxID=183268 RepID=A0A9W7LNA6_HIBTR|nr:hypothetical protein HRI_000758600 [Hibiscus trionum]
MKTKTPVFKRRPRKSVPPSFASLISALLYQDEDNEEYHLHGNDNGESMDTGSSEDNDNNNNDDVDDKDDDEEEGYDDGSGKGIAGAYDNDLVPGDVNEEVEDDNVVPDDVNKEVEEDNVVPDDVNKEVEEDNVVPDCVEVGESAGVKCVLADWLGVFSYSCSGGSSQVLVCSENGCPIAMHVVCMNTEPDFDDTGKFYCPYCWHNRVVARTLDLRREALLAKRELLNFIHLKRDVGNEEKHEDGADNMKAASLSTTAGEKNSGDCENGLNDDANETIYYNQEQTMCVVSKGKGKPDDESTSKIHGADNVADVQMMQEEDIENTSDSKIDGSALEDNQGKSRTTAKDAKSKVPAIESFEHVSSDLDTGTLVRQKRIKHTAQRARPRQVDSPKSLSFQPGTSAKDKMTNLQGNARTEKKSVQCRELNKQMIPITSNGKRRPLPWTTEEVNMLKEGVRRFSLTSNKNMPWRKILEFGHNIFDGNRIPVDLKDKWKQIMAKEDPKSNMGTLIPSEE